MSSCQLCGNAVTIDGAIAVCSNCGAEYDVIKRHGRGRADFGASSQLSIGAKQFPTSEKIYLGPYPMGPGIQPFPPGTVLYVGTKITVRMGIYSTDEGKFISPNPAPVTLWHKLDAAAWEKLWVGGWAAADVFDFTYTLPKSGTHTFYIEWPGTDVYAGCEGGVHAKVLSGDYGSSLEVSLQVQPALTVVVKDIVTKKQIVGAKVVVDTTEAVTDDSGTAIFDGLASGTYTLTVSARDYKSESRTIDLTMLGKVEEVHLLPMWAIAAGVVGASSVGLVVALKLRKR